MSTIRNPVGPQSSRVYWRRRLAVLIGLLVVILIIVLIVARPGSGKPSGLPSNTPSSSASIPPAAACDPKNVEVDAVTDQLSYAAGVDPQFSLTITNTGTTPCSFSDGSNVQEYVITSGTERIWSSKDCQTGAVAATTSLQPGKAVHSTPFPWDRTRSNPSACSATNAAQVIAGGASYHLAVTVNGITSAKDKSPQFILK